MVRIFSMLDVGLQWLDPLETGRVGVSVVTDSRPTALNGTMCV